LQSPLLYHHCNTLAAAVTIATFTDTAAAWHLCIAMMMLNPALTALQLLPGGAGGAAGVMRHRLLLSQHSLTVRPLLDVTPAALPDATDLSSYLLRLDTAAAKVWVPTLSSTLLSVYLSVTSCITNSLIIVDPPPSQTNADSVK
jgi:hypothetical protein